MNKPPVPWGKAVRVSVDLVDPNPWNPNRMTEEELRKEAESFKRFGFVVPIVVRAQGERYQIVDGEQRWTVARSLGMAEIDAYDIAPMGDFEAKQLTYILNELKGKPQEDELAELLQGLLKESTIDDLTDVMPLSKEQFAKAAKMPDFDWADLEKQNKEGPKSTFVERIFRMPVESAAVLDRALQKVKDHDEGNVSDVQALEVVAAYYLGEA